MSRVLCPAHKALTVLSCPPAPDLARSCQGTDDAEKGLFPWDAVPASRSCLSLSAHLTSQNP